MKPIIDPKLTKICPGCLPLDWQTRAIFSNEYGSQAWISRMVDAHSPENFPALHQAYVDLLKPMGPIYSFVSFGPGGTSTDLNLLDQVSQGQPVIYIPIDISPILLELACGLVEGQYSLPMAILADFEGGYDFIRKTLPETLKGPTVFSILGNAVGNSDIGERQLIGQLTGLLKGGDYLLISVATGRFDTAILKEKIQLLSSGAISSLLAGGLSMITAEPYKRVKSDMIRRVDVRMGGSEVDGGTALTFFDTMQGQDIFTSRRYDFDRMGHWFEDQFPLELVGAINTLLPEGNLGIGSFLLRPGGAA